MLLCDVTNATSYVVMHPRISLEKINAIDDYSKFFLCEMEVILGKKNNVLFLLHFWANTLSTVGPTLWLPNNKLEVLRTEVLLREDSQISISRSKTQPLCS